MRDCFRWAAQLCLAVAGLGSAELIALENDASFRWDELKSAGQVLSAHSWRGPTEDSVLKVTSDLGRP